MPKMTGRLLSERLGTWSFWTMLIGFNVTFGPMHVLGQLGMARRVYTYGNGMGWDTLNLVVSLGSLLFAAGTLMTVVNVGWALRRGALAPADPWHADTLEWSIASPAPEHNFTVIPVVTSRHPLWQLDEYGEEVLAVDRPAGPEGRGTPITGGLDTEHEEELIVPQPTALPALAALGVLVFFVGMLISATVVLVAGTAIGITGVVAWGWRTELDRPT
jgi:heme/copper-type cytochrome/quinol oxidase subunit 1